jgi:predicted transcriptional regulator
MATVAQSIRLEAELLSIYDQLAEATGRSRNQLFVEALKRFAVTEGWQIQQVRATLARLEQGTLAIVPGEQVVADLLARGRVTQEALDEARSRAGVSAHSDR